MRPTTDPPRKTEPEAPESSGGLGRTALRVVQIAFIAGAASLAYSYVASARDGELRMSCTSVCAMAPAYAGADRGAPDFELPTIDGPPFRLSNHRGKTVVLVFWTTTCDSCKQQMPALRQLAAVFQHDRRFEMLTVAVDESLSDVVATVQQHTGMKDPFPMALDPESEVVLGKYGTKAFPETWVIDPSGTVRMRFDGPRDWSGSLAIDLLRNVARGATCPITVESLVAKGPGAKICRDDSM
jgi:peroxiredoxin